MPVLNSLTDDEKQPPILAECGDTGLKHHSGYVDEEWHPDLAGTLGVKVYREMYNNEPIIGATFLLIQLIARKIKTWVDPTGETLEHQLAAELCRTALNDVDGGTEGLMANALSLLPYGWSWLEKVFKISRGDNESHIFRSKYDDGKIRWRKLAIRAQESLDRWDIGEHGELNGMWQRPAPHYRLVYLPRAKSLHFRVLTDKNNPEGLSFLRWLYTSYHFKKNLQFSEAVGVYRNVAGYPVMEVPPAIVHPNATAAQQAIKAEWEEVVKKVTADEMMGLVVPAEVDSNGKPTGYRFRLIASSGRNLAETDPIIKRYATWMALGLMAQFILLGSDKVGSFALADSQTDMFGHGVGAVIDAVLQQMNEDAFPELCALNGLPRSVSPEMKRGDVETPDLAKIGAYLQATIGSGAIVPDDSLDEHLREIASFPTAERTTARPGAGAMPTDMADPMMMGATEPKAADPADEFVPTMTPAEMARTDVKWLTVKEVAERWRFSPGTVSKLIRTGQLPAVRLGSRFRVAQHEVEEFEQGEGGNGQDLEDEGDIATA